mmetsp:Transcript_6400/g.19089  ORF Transcript_6400/g.19089 Transcript_6400/m.19089 type:complete len:106 (-) Transcript_6400:55-372(-)
MAANSAIFRPKEKGKIRDMLAPNEWSRRRLSLIKMINEGEEVFVLLFPRRITNTCFESTVLRVLEVRSAFRFQKEREETNQTDGNKKIWRFLKTKNRPENGKPIF